MTTIAVFNVKGGVGKTSLVYHLAWMYADLGLRVIAADLDPQASLSRMFVDEVKLDRLWSEEDGRHTVHGAIQPLLEERGDIRVPRIEPAGERIGVLVGSLALSKSEYVLDREWTQAAGGSVRALRVLPAFGRILEQAARDYGADVVLIDLAPNMGAINHAALIAADHVVFPTVPDIFAAEGLKHLGPRLHRWREEWRRLRNQPAAVSGLSGPGGEIKPAGYTVLRHAVRLEGAAQAADRWLQRIPSAYHEFVLGEPSGCAPASVYEDPHCLAIIKQYRSLMPLALEARKPVFHLKPADGAIGGHARAVQDSYHEYHALAVKLAERCEIPLR
jgi:cellulose biosynthesis protein BcsQ